MYTWVTHTHTHLAGRCPHACAYCYVQAMIYKAVKARYSGDLRLLEEEFKVNYGSGKVIFIEHCNDLFASPVPAKFISRILAHCRQYPDNKYVIQTKNPERLKEFIDQLPPKRILGTTIETDLAHHVMGKAPATPARAQAVADLRDLGLEVYITVEPILAFTPAFAKMLKDANPSWVNVGADSKGHGLPEPAKTELVKLLADLKKNSIEVRQKSNLARLL